MALCPSPSTTGTLPQIPEILPAISLNILILNGTTKNCDAPKSAPISVRMNDAFSSSRCSRISAALSKMSRLTEGFVDDHSGNAVEAASTALIASWGDAETAFQQGLLV